MTKPEVEQHLSILKSEVALMLIHAEAKEAKQVANDIVSHVLFTLSALKSIK